MSWPALAPKGVGVLIGGQRLGGGAVVGWLAAPFLIGGGGGADQGWGCRRLAGHPSLDRGGRANWGWGLLANLLQPLSTASPIPNWDRSLAGVDIIATIHLVIHSGHWLFIYMEGDF